MTALHPFQRALFGTMVMLCFTPHLHAGLVFRDNFSDTDHTDGSPVSWVNTTWSFQRDTTIDASSSDLIISRGPGRKGTLAIVPDLELAEISVRTQVRMPSGGLAGIMARHNERPSTLDQYGAWIDSNGGLGFGVKVDDVGDIIDTADTEFNIAEEDIVLQFDVIGSRLSLWAWRAGESMPAEPQLTAVNSAVPTGTVGVWARGLIGNEAHSAIFRYVHVADVHIPEPASFLLAAFGIVCLYVCARRHTR